MGGVDRVFVEHPIYEAAGDDIYGANYTYADTDSGVADLDLRWSILSQAALAAPLLLWPPPPPPPLTGEPVPEGEPEGLQGVGC